eukprot:6645107-Karenia_brevis.AAC.1
MDSKSGYHRKNRQPQNQFDIIHFTPYTSHSETPVPDGARVKREQDPMRQKHSLLNKGSRINGDPGKANTNKIHGSETFFKTVGLPWWVMGGECVWDRRCWGLGRFGVGKGPLAHIPN